MASFPLLKTGAVAQYPLQRSVGFSTETVQFLDGSRQRYRTRGSGLRSWTVKLDQLDQAELSAIIAFVEQQEGGIFAFTDPTTGEVVSKCVFAVEQLGVELMDEMQGRAELVIEEVR
jgi:hypothetical protein